MKRNVTSSQNSEARKTAMTQLGRMFVYIALKQIRGYKVCSDDLSIGAGVLFMKLYDLGVAKFENDGSVDGVGGNNMCVLTTKGEELLPRYLAACADELRDGHFGKMKWDKRTKFHKAILARIA